MGNHNTSKKKYIINIFLNKKSANILQNEIHCIEEVKKNDTENKGSKTGIKVVKKKDTKNNNSKTEVPKEKKNDLCSVNCENIQPTRRNEIDNKKIMK